MNFLYQWWISTACRSSTVELLLFPMRMRGQEDGAAGTILLLPLPSQHCLPAPAHTQHGVSYVRDLISHEPIININLLRG